MQCPMEKIRPLGDRVVVKPDSKEETTRCGIIIPDTAKEKPQEGTVTAVGSGRFLDNGKRSVMELGVGDHVLFARYGGTEIILNDEIYLVLRKCDILAVLD
jgi:chaperonin GroES